MKWVRFEAKVLFLDLADVSRATEALAMFDCEVEIDHDAIDDHGPTVFGMVTGTTELGEDDLGDWLVSIVGPFGGDVVEWGFSHARLR
jgi:hypothetical protein